MKIFTDNIGSIINASDKKTWTGDRLIVEVERRCKILSKYGVKRGDRVIILHGGTAEFFADLFAVWSLGCCASCLNPGSTTSEVKKILELLRPAIILVGKSQNNIPDIGVTSVDLTVCDFDNRVEVSSFGRLDDNALILFTSGTTGVPKGVVHTFRSLLSRISLNQVIIPIEERKVTLSPLPTHFGHGLIGNCLTPLLSGQDLVLVNGSDIQMIAKLGEIIDKHEITFMSSVPAMWKIATKLSLGPKKGTLKRIHIGSSPLSEDLWNQVINWSGIQNVLNMYGITETANWIAGVSAAEVKPQDGMIGKMWGGNAAVLINGKNIVSEGEGELLIQTPSVMSGYYQCNELNDKAFFKGWFRTGDIGLIDSNGVIKLTGRKKFEINRAGLKIHPEDIDILLERHPLVSESCAFGIPDPISGEIVAVAVSLLEKNSVKASELEKWCQKYLVQEKIPERWFILSDIPKTDRGKINRNNVAEVCLK
jgi:oxalate---CoA ligase